MENENIKREALRLEKLFQDTILREYNVESYKNISEIVNFMKIYTENLQQLSCDKVTFIIGPTGAGKSTLMNYLSKEDNLLVSDYGQMYAKDSIADIGEGTTGSTTLFPNTWKHSDIEGVFIDCAGDFDSRGMIIEAINSKIKTFLANNVKSAKMLFVVPQTSLSAEGAYGKIFKEALDKNAKFFKDINYFRDSILLVISHANRSIKTPEMIDTLLINVMNQFSLSSYTGTMKHVIEKSNMVIFCKPSDEAHLGNSYEPPAWNKDERKLIMSKIIALDFITIPQKNFFNISSSLEFKEQIEKALNIVKKKAGEVLMNATKMAITPKLNVYATELKPFADFVKQLITKEISTGLEQYIRYLNYNNFLAVSPDTEVINKLTGELKYLESFIDDQQNSTRIIGNGYGWNFLSGISSLLHNIYEEVIAITCKSSELFTEFRSCNNLIIKGGFSDSESVKNAFKELRNKLEEKSNVETLMYNTASQYYYNKEVKTIDSMEKEFYTRTETYSESEPYIEKEIYEKDVPYTKTEYYDEDEAAPVRTIIVGALTLGTVPLAKGLFTGDATMYDTVRKSRNVTCYRKELVEKELTKYKDVVKSKEVEDHRYKPVYKFVIKREFNETKYNEDIREIDDFISKRCEDIKEILTKMEKANQDIEATLSEDVLNKVKMNIMKSQENTQDEFMTPFKDLYDKWKSLEYQSLFLNKPAMSLDINNMELLLGQDNL